MNWISIKDQSPPFRERILVVKYYSHRSREYSVEIDSYHGELEYNMNRIGEITHWMPLPKPPTQSIYKEDFLNKHFRFPKDNKIEWSMDFLVYPEDIPHDIDFELTDCIDDELVTLRARGYGIIERNKPEYYGNGAISVKLKDIIDYRID